MFGPIKHGIQPSSAFNAQAEIAASDYPEIRLFTVKTNSTKSGRKSGGGRMVAVFTSLHTTLLGSGLFSSTGPYLKLKVPIGLINTSWGGTVRNLISPETISGDPDFAPSAGKYEEG